MRWRAVLEKPQATKETMSVGVISFIAFAALVAGQLYQPYYVNLMTVYDEIGPS